MSRYKSSGRRQARPPGLWHSIPPWIRGAAISYVLLLVLFLINGIGATIAMVAGSDYLAPVLICYSIQLIFYVINGMLAGWQADETRAVQVRRVGFRGEVVRLNLANYVAAGALAGLVLAILAAITYFVAQQVMAQLIPGIQLLSLIGAYDVPWLFLVVDTLAAVTVGMLGGVIYDRTFAAPGRR